MGEAKRRRGAGKQTVFELQLLDGPTLAELMLDGPPDEVCAATAAVKEVVANLARRARTGAAPLLCAACDNSFRSDMPAAVMVARPFAASDGEMIVGAICETCAALGREAVAARILAQLRSTGAMPDARQLEVGSA